MNLYYVENTLDNIEFRGGIWNGIEETWYRWEGHEYRNPIDFFPDWDKYNEDDKGNAEVLVNELMDFKEALELVEYFQGNEKVVATELRKIEFPFPGKFPGKPYLPYSMIGVGGRTESHTITAEGTGKEYRSYFDSTNASIVAPQRPSPEEFAKDAIQKFDSMGLAEVVKILLKKVNSFDSDCHCRTGSCATGLCFHRSKPDIPF